MHQKPTKTCITSAEFGRLYSDYNPRFTEVAYRYVRDRGIAEDLVSDSFMAFWEERDRLPEDVNAPAYVLTIVKNKCLNHLKARLLHLQIEKKLHSTQQRLIQSDIQSLAAFPTRCSWRRCRRCSTAPSAGCRNLRGAFSKAAATRTKATKSLLRS